MSVKFHPAARAELLEARLWYEERSPLAAVAFAQEINSVVSCIAESPMQFPLAEHGTRRAVLQRFPYNVFYRVGAEENSRGSRSPSEAPTGLLDGSVILDEG